MSTDSPTDVMFRNVRREERKETNWIAKIRLFDGSEIATSVKDISASGARLAVPESMELPERFMFRVIGHDFVCAVKVMWRRGSHVGVRIERVGKLDPNKQESKLPKPQQDEATAGTFDPGADPGADSGGGDLVRRRGSRISQF